jgi:release factor glutamine methyltransferase
MQVRQALHRARRMLEPVSDSPDSDARVLLADTLGTSTTWLLAHDEDELHEQAAGLFDHRLRRCADGEPLPYVLGWWEFYGRRFAVDPRVLIPRPETELLVEEALVGLRSRAQLRVVDVGTGSGCIGVTLAAEEPECTVFASDVSRQALDLARANAASHGVERRMRWVQVNLFDGISGVWDVVCANLPYVREDRVQTLSVARHEPSLALDGGRHGTELVARLIRSLASRLAPGGLALLEIDEDQAHDVTSIAREALPEATVDVLQDLRAKARCLRVRREPDVA